MKSRYSVLRLVAALVILTVVTIGCSGTPRDLPDGLYAVIRTDRGEIIVRLAPEEAPMTVMNFVGLAEGTIDNTFRPGKPFYDGLTFHRVEPDFVIQGGDPNGNGTGGPGYQFPTETHPSLLHDGPGVVAMANSGMDTNGSQFYITMRATPHLDGGYNVFGRVERGMEVVTAIRGGDTMKTVRIVRVGTEAKAYKATTEQFGELVDDVYITRELGAMLTRQQALSTIASRWPDAREHGSAGLLLVPLAPGSGDVPASGQEISVHIVFSLLDGTELDNTRDRGEPYEFAYLVERLLPGLELAIGTLTVGERKLAIVPPELAFGAVGMPPVIPAGAYVLFEVERLK